MGKIKKILENELVGGTQTTDVYPVTSTKAVYDENNERLDNVLRGLRDKIGILENAGYLYAGVATIDTDPKTPDAKVFYIANGKGIYTNFGGINVTEDDVVILYYDTIWHKEATGIASNEKLTELESEVIDSVLNLHDADLNLNVFGSARHKLDTKYNASQETSVVIFKNLNLKRDNTISFTGILSAENMNSAYINIKDSKGDSIHRVIFVKSGSTTGSTIPYTPTQDYNNVSIVLTCNTTASWEITATVVDYIEKDVNANKTNIAAETERAEGAENTLQANIDTVSEEVRNLDRVVDYVSSEIDSEHINTGAIYYYDGQVLGYTNYFYTEPIHLLQGDKVYTTAALIANINVAVLSIVESDGTWIRTIQRLSDGLLEYTANKDCYIVISAPKAHLAYFRILTSSISKGIVKINNIDSYLGMSVISIDVNSLVKGSFRKALDGEIESLKGYSYSQPIQVHKGDTLVKNNITIGSVIAFITRVDSQGNALGVLKVGTGSAHNYYEIFDFNGYISISGITDSLMDTIILSSRLITQISSKGGVTVDNTDKLVSIELNPLSPLLREYGYGCLIKQWGFIGDSYTSGATPAYLDGALKPIDMYKWSWGQQFMKIIGAEGYNFSNGGQTAKGWLSNQGTVHDDTYVGGVGGGDWRLAQTELKHGYIISLGINDKGKFGEDYLGAVYSLGDVDTDVDVSDYTNNNENTYAGCYAGIIQRILSVQPKAKIFCMTQFQDALEDVNGVVRKIVTKLNSNNVFLLDMHEYAMDITQISGYMSNGHPSAYGYAYMAALINTYIDYIIRNNKSKFLDVTLIGTNYSLT